MDNTAHRTIKQARDLLVDTFGLGLRSPCRLVSVSPEQRSALEAVAEQLWVLLTEDPAPPECQECATPLIQPATGRPRRFCSTACRSADYRSRGGAVRSTAPTDPPYAGAEWCSLHGTWTDHTMTDHMAALDPDD